MFIVHRNVYLFVKVCGILLLMFLMISQYVNQNLKVNVNQHVIQQDTLVANKSSLRQAKYIALLASITDISPLTILGVVIPLGIWILVSPQLNTIQDQSYCLDPFSDINQVVYPQDTVNTC